VFASPAARKTAREAGIDLASPHGSGPNGRIVLRDLEGVAGGSAGGSAGGEIFAQHLNASAASQKATAILIHGLYGDADTWAGVSKTLADAGVPVLAIDLPVHGRTTANARTFDEVVSAVTAFVRERVPGRKLLVGHSLGGAVAVKVAQALGERDVDGVALIAPAGLGTEIDAGFIEGMLHASTPALLRREIDKLTVRAQPFSDARVADMHTQLRRRGDALEAFVSRFAVRGVQQIDVRSALEALTVPVTVFWGRQDRVLPWQHALSLPPSVALHLFPEAGHMPQWENGKVVSKVLLRMAG
jgi:pyruvate dehydrogenase E2 component (dihydrolipoamide acetyltransferase)